MYLHSNLHHSPNKYLRGIEQMRQVISSIEGEEEQLVLWRWNQLRSSQLMGTGPEYELQTYSISWQARKSSEKVEDEKMNG
jgi:hypothetical protein